MEAVLQYGVLARHHGLDVGQVQVLQAVFHRLGGAVHREDGLSEVVFRNGGGGGLPGHGGHQGRGIVVGLYHREL